MNTPPDISEMLFRLRSFYQPSGERIWSALVRHLEDPLRPRTSRDHFRFNPVVLLLLVLLSTTVATFLAFNSVQR